MAASENSEADDLVHIEDVSRKTTIGGILKIAANRLHFLGFPKMNLKMGLLQRTSKDVMLQLPLLKLSFHLRAACIPQKRLARQDHIACNVGCQTTRRAAGTLASISAAAASSDGYTAALPPAECLMRAISPPSGLLLGIGFVRRAARGRARSLTWTGR